MLGNLRRPISHQKPSISGAEVSKTFRHWCQSVTWTLRTSAEVS